MFRRLSLEYVSTSPLVGLPAKHRVRQGASGVAHLAALVSGLDQNAGLVRYCPFQPTPGVPAVPTTGWVLLSSACRQFCSGQSGPAASTSGPARPLASFLQETSGAPGQPYAAAKAGSDLRSRLSRKRAHR